MYVCTSVYTNLCCYSTRLDFRFDSIRRRPAAPLSHAVLKRRASAVPRLCRRGRLAVCTIFSSIVFMSSFLSLEMCHVGLFFISVSDTNAACRPTLASCSSRRSTRRSPARSNFATRICCSHSADFSRVPSNW